MAKKVKIEAKDVETAIAQGLKELGLRRDQAEVLILTRPTKGFLGIGAKQAVVEVRQKRWQGGNLDAQIYMDVPKRKDFPRNGKHEKKDRAERGERDARGGGKFKKGRPGKFDKRGGGKKERFSEEPKTPKANEPQQLPSSEIQNAVIPENLKAPMQEAKEMLNKMLEHMGVKCENLNAWWDQKQQRILLTFDCDHPAIVIGKEGKTLEAAQYLLTLALSRHFSTPISVMADTQNYWKKAEDKIYAEIDRGINTIKRGLKVYRLRPMPAQMRRFVHRALENNEFVETASEGEGKWRKVVIKERTSPAGKAENAEDKAMDAAAKSPAKCVTVNIEKETARAEIKLDAAVAEEKARKKAEAGVGCDNSSRVSADNEGNPACAVTTKQEEGVLKEAPESLCRPEEQMAEKIQNK
ncbi:MAG: Jag N-terminal domain-containing protein [Elusimicrobium sp.]|jgi:spoIIIJ-associated protein|nr:Jag N-terminal domain-containing protein [Elusimicrobium sp.]